MSDPSEENTKDHLLCNRLTIFGSTLKDSFVLAVEDNYRILHGGDTSNIVRRASPIRVWLSSPGQEVMLLLVRRKRDLLPAIGRRCYVTQT